MVYVKHVETVDGHERMMFAPEGATEVPTCPVCLDRMDPAASGVFTTLCNHSFHANCLSFWRDSTCPVCRYYQEADLQVNKCSTCQATESLWMCLLCGHVGMS